MKVLMLNGGWRADGNSAFMLDYIASELEKDGIESEIVNIGAAPVRDCLGCGKCSETGRCVFEDDGVNDFIDKAEGADGFIFATPVFYAHPAGRVLDFMDRVFYAAFRKVFDGKPGAAICVARRAGTTAALDVMNKYFGIGGMPCVGSTYWNELHGFTHEDLMRDEEGMQTLRNLARNMAWLMRCIEAGRAAGIEHPEPERGARTHFIMPRG
ncbi:MAG: flavodoxin family protein [Atopobiaceae bacterium]|nr:flavodoxin family protein [Atopobiaceae bacterium]